MLIRHLSHNDYVEYKTLHNSDIDKDYFDNFLDNVLCDRHMILVIEFENMIVGTGTIFIEEKLTHGGCRMGHIENIFIKETHRCKGFGEKIVNELLKISKELAMKM